MELDALSTQSGTTRWRFQTESGSDDGYLTDPVIYDGIIYVGLRSTLYALDGQSGQVKWKLKLSGAITNATTISDDTVYIGTYSVGGGDDTYLYALDSKTGQEKWKLQVTAGGIVGGIGGAVALVDGVAYVGTTNSGLLSLDAENGQEKWRYYPGSGVTTGPAVAYNTVYVTDRGNLYAVDAQTGKEKWKVEEQGVFYSDPVIADGIVYFTSTRTGLGVLFGNDPDGYLYAADAQSGQELWTLHVPGIASRAPAVADGVVYFGTEAGTFYAVK
jgi:outer membrane protein assembly factor BamB